MKKVLLLLWYCVFFIGGAFGQSSFSRGEELFLHNKPQEALPYFEAEIIENPGNIRAFLYLGVSFQQLKRLDEAITIYRRVLPRAGNETALIAYNLGNVYYTKGNITLAEEFYNRALAADSVFAPAYLNRANARLSRQALQEAVVDYEVYLSLEPLSPKRAVIEQIIAAIGPEPAGPEGPPVQAEIRAEAEQVEPLPESVVEPVVEPLPEEAPESPESPPPAAAEEPAEASPDREEAPEYEGEGEGENE